MDEEEKSEDENQEHHAENEEISHLEDPLQESKLNNEF